MTINATERHSYTIDAQPAATHLNDAQSDSLTYHLQDGPIRIAQRYEQRVKVRRFRGPREQRSLCHVQGRARYGATLPTHCPYGHSHVRRCHASQLPLPPLGRWLKPLSNRRLD
eukprot:scaffold181434_cov31-Tisochrysis_lutea.AAC.3